MTIMTKTNSNFIGLSIYYFNINMYKRPYESNMSYKLNLHQNKIKFLF